MNAVVAWILDLLYPPKCAFCRRLVSDPCMICPACEKNLPYTNGRTGKRKLDTISTVISPLLYEGSVREAMLRFKFQGAAVYSAVFGRLLAAEIEKSGIQADAICWIPLSRKRLRKRGYDQARLLAEETAERLHIPCMSLLEKTRNNPAQSGVLGREERKRNVSGVYRFSGKEVIEGKKILLIDDIITTGATMEEASRILRQAGAKEVYGAAAATREI